MIAENDVVDVESGTRSLTIKVYGDYISFLNLSITTYNLRFAVIVFNAHVLKWTLDGNPPDEHVRHHHIREASFYNTDEWSIETSSPHEKLRVDFVGIEEKDVARKEGFACGGEG